VFGTKLRLKEDSKYQQTETNYTETYLKIDKTEGIQQ